MVFYSDNLSEIFSYCDIIIHFLHFDIRGSDLGSKLTSQHSNCNVFDNTHTVWKNENFTLIQKSKKKELNSTKKVDFT